MSTGSALNPMLNPPSHKPLSHLSDPEMLTYIDNITRYFHDIGVNANTKGQVDAMTNIRMRMEWLQARLGIMEELLNTQSMNGVELRQMLKECNTASKLIKNMVDGADGPPKMLIVEKPSMAHPYPRRFINFDWIEHYLATNHNVTPADAVRAARDTLKKELFPTGVPSGTVIDIKTDMRNPEIIVERTHKTRI